MNLPFTGSKFLAGVFVCLCLHRMFVCDTVFCWKNACCSNTGTRKRFNECTNIACRCNGSQIYGERAQRACFEHVACEVAETHKIKPQRDQYWPCTMGQYGGQPCLLSARKPSVRAAVRTEGTAPHFAPALDVLVSGSCCYEEYNVCVLHMQFAIRR